MHEVINLFREDMHLDTEYTCHELFNKKAIEKEYEDYKQEYRDLSEENKTNRIESSGCDDIEEYIQMVMDIFGCGTLEEC